MSKKNGKIIISGVPSPAGGLLILMPLIYELSELSFQINVTSLTPFYDFSGAFS